MAGDNGERISVSREALRAELAEMELRLRELLQLKADKSSVVALQSEVMSQGALLTRVEGKVQEIDHYGSAEMRAVKERVRTVESALVTDDQVEAAVSKVVEEARSQGGHRMMWVGVLIAGLAFFANVAIQVAQVMAS